MSYCEHDPECSGAGWAHDAQLTPTQREELGLPRGEISMAHAKRLMRAYRKGWGDGLREAELRAREQLVSVSAVDPMDADTNGLGDVDE